MKLSILIPVYNEKKTILDLLKAVEKVDLGDVKKEIVLVDDGSTDGSREILESVKNKYKVIFHEKNGGKGAAIRIAIKHATGDIMVIQDADLEYDPQDFRRLIKPILSGETKVVYGSRLMHEKLSTIKIFRSHYIGNKVLTFITNLFYHCKLTDMETCYKMFKKEVLQGVPLKAKGFELEPEITSKILKRGFKIKELPINYNFRTYGEGKKIKKFDGVKAIYYLMKYRFMD